jgi:hypothetical protein
MRKGKRMKGIELFLTAKIPVIKGTISPDTKWPEIV